MGGVYIVFNQQIVETMLGSRWQGVWQLEAELAKTRGANRYQQGGDGLAAIAQVLQAGIDKIATRQS